MPVRDTPASPAHHRADTRCVNPVRIPDGAVVMNTLDLLSALLYLGGFATFAVAGAFVPMGWRYWLCLSSFPVALLRALDWAMIGADGPGGFGVVILHGLLFQLFVAAHVVRWAILVARWWSAAARRHDDA